MQGADAQISFALVPHQDQRRACPANNQQRLFKPGIKPGQISQIREVLAIPIDNDMRELALLHAGAQVIYSCFQLKK
jgi:hypothetical protein